MSKFFLSKKVALIAAAVIVLGIEVYLLFSGKGNAVGEGGGDNTPQPPTADNRPGFREGAREAGITFHMDFLPAEQGRNFKVNLYDHGCGVAVADYDGDGYEDVYFVNQLGKNALYRNRGKDKAGTWLGFEDVTDKARVAVGDRVCVGAVFADYKNNGRPGLYVTSTRGGNILFEQLPDGTFKDVTKDAGLTLIAYSQTATFFDYNNDGYLDLFVTNTAEWTLDNYDSDAHYFPGRAGLYELGSSKIEYNRLYRNNKDGTFTDVTEESGLKGKGWGGDVAVFDYNDDGYLDILVSNMFGSSQLYRNNKNGTFTDVTRDILGSTSWGAIGCKVFDFNNDGRLDLYIVDMHSDMWLQPGTDPRSFPGDDLKKKYAHATGPTYDAEGGPAVEQHLADAFKIRYDQVVFGNTFFKKLPSGKFEEVSAKANLETFWPWGIATGDFNNDGYEDIFLPSGMGFPYSYWPNALLMNNGDETFTDRAAEMKIDPPRGGIYMDEKIGGRPAPRSSRAVAAADFDGDGRIDLMVNNFNDNAYFYRNEFPQRNYVAFRLTGTTSNREAIGALVKIHMGKEVMLRQVQAAGGYLSQSSRTVHFGLGDRDKIDRVEILWPRGIRQQIEGPAINTLHRVTEPKKTE